MGYLIYLRFYCILIIGFIGRVCTHMTVINDNDKWQDFNVEQYTTNVYDSSLKTTLMPAKTLSVYSEQNGISGPISVYNDYIGGDDMHIKHDDEQKHGIHESADIDRHSTQGHNDNYTPSAESNAFSEEYEESSSKAVFNNCETEKNNGKMHSNELKPENSQQYQSKGNKHTHCFDEDLHNRRPRRDQPEQKSFEKGLEIDFIQKELGEEYIVPPKRPKQIPGYVAMLYDILTEQDERTLIPASSEKIKSRPKIRFYRGLFHGIGKNKWISYDMKDIDLEQVTRLEFVVKMPKMKERNTSISLYVDADTDVIDKVEVSFVIYEDYIVCDLSALITNKQLNNFKIMNHLSAIGNTHTISRLQEPLILVYENHQSTPYPTSFDGLPGREKRNANNIQEIMSIDYSYYPDNPTELICGRQDWSLPMEDFNWTWWLLPTHINAGVCTGSCNYWPHAANNTSSYVFLTSLWHEITYGLNEMLVPRAHCVPNSFHPMTVAYMPNNKDWVFVQIQDIQIASCACR